MKKILSASILVLILVCAGCLDGRKDTVVQVSTIDALLAGLYDGQMACGQLLKYGDTGIGTFDALDGEMVVLDGRIYQVKFDGSIASPEKDLKTPFASVVWFGADESITVAESVDMAGFTERIDKQVNAANSFYAVKAHGNFSYMKTRSVPAQKKPYPELAEVAKGQAVFENRGVTGSVVGFYCPGFVKGINVAGYHLHFISDDEKCGGHILDFVMETGSVEIDKCSRFLMILPQDDSVFGSVDLAKDRTRDLHTVEN